ncbi:14778_t:CDS:2 [Gigaspora margarita]|uniref:14778_t:CDS:1 n=1 Tax=Gigaspora margarita TaxID=4874 RepID=A0ABN7UYE3_GIGMA|nr:14778_t:CDS:2 [Gigaspora margarita]
MKVVDVMIDLIWEPETSLAQLLAYLLASDFSTSRQIYQAKTEII